MAQTLLSVDVSGPCPANEFPVKPHQTLDLVKMPSHPLSMRINVTRPAHPVVAVVLGAAVAALSVVGVVGTAAPASAHPSAWTSVSVETHEGYVTLDAEIPLDRYAVATHTDIDATAAGVEAAAASIETYLLDNIEIDIDGEPATLQVESVLLGSRSGQSDLAVRMTTADLDDPSYAADGSLGDVRLTWRAVTAQIPSHKVYVSEEVDGQTELIDVLTNAHAVTSISAGTEDAARSRVSVREMVDLGMEHIATGYDHLLFLTMLLLPAPLAARRRRTGLPALRLTLRRVVLVATAFTVGHSITLALVSFGVLQVPRRPVETLVAVSIVVAAVHAWRPLVNRGEVLIAAGFGLVHGTAFATTILELGLDRGATVRAVLGFNLGIEAAQLIVIVAVVPLLFLASANRDYRLLMGTLATLGTIAAVDWIIAIWRGGSARLEPVFDTVGKHHYLAWGALAAIAVTMWLVRQSAPVDPAPSTTDELELRARRTPVT